MVIATMTRRAALGLLAAATLAAPAAPAVAAAPAAPSAGDDAARNRKIVDDAFARWAAGGSGFFDEVLHDDVVWTIEGSGPSAGVYRGRRDFVDKAVRPFVSRLSVPVRPVARQVWADGEHVIARWDGEAKAADGVPYRNSYVWIFRMRDGRAVEATAFLDLAPYDDVLRRVAAPR